MKTRYLIECRGQRGDQESYTYTVHESVKPGKAQRLVDQAATNIAAHERGSDKAKVVQFDWGVESGEDIAPVRVAIGIATFIIRATPITKE